MARFPLEVARIRAAARSWQHIEVVTETGSTNADLMARAHAGADIGGAVLFAEYQAAGRGRHGRVWTAAPMSQIAVSVGVDVSGMAPQTWGWLPLLTGMAVVDAVRTGYGVDAGLKWPNDVLVGEGKLAGILAEVASPRPVVVVGIGLNVTLRADEVPDAAATSLAILGCQDVDRTELAAALLQTLDRRIGQWRRGDPGLAADYRARSLTIGTQVRALLPGGKTLVGLAESIDDAGRLRIDDGSELITVSAGDITHLRPV